MVVNLTNEITTIMNNETVNSISIIINILLLNNHANAFRHLKRLSFVL